MEEEDYSSDSDDEDYVPTKGGLGSEEENSGEDEDILLAEEGDDVDGDDDNNVGNKMSKGRMKENSQKKKTVKKKRGRKSNASHKKETTESIPEQLTLQNEVVDKKKADDLWADFLKDVGGPTKKSLGATQSTTTSSTTTSTTTTATATDSKKVTIIKEFNFAGETVKVSTEVDANSKEAKIFSTSAASTSTTSTSTTTTTTNATTSSSSSSSSSSSFISKLSNTNIKRPAGGLTNLLENLQKKPKMSVLDKSKLDWTGFKREEGIEEELQQHNRGKNGYLDRVAFLQRADIRQYEMERDLRMASSRKPSI